MYHYKDLKNYTLKELFDRSIKLYKNNIALGDTNGNLISYEELGEKVKKTVEILKTKRYNKRRQSSSS